MVQRLESIDKRGILYAILLLLRPIEEELMTLSVYAVTVLISSRFKSVDDIKVCQACIFAYGSMVC